MSMISKENGSIHPMHIPRISTIFKNEALTKIKKRGERLANECFKIWNLPQEYQNNIIEAR